MIFIRKNVKSHVTHFKGLSILRRCLFIVMFFGFLIVFKGCKSENEDYKTDIANQHQTNADTTSLLLSKYKKQGDAYIIPWNYMLNVTFEKKYSDSLGMEVSLPIFNDTLKVLNGKKVIVEGFYIPVDETGDETIVILSAYPFAQCFFCGQAGVESIVDIITTQKLPKLKVDTKIRFKGRLKLNRDNFDFLIYMLEDAELIQ